MIALTVVVVAVTALAVSACAPAGTQRDSGQSPKATPKPSADAGGAHDDVGAAGIGDPYAPLLGNGGYDVSHYTLDLDYEPDSEQLDAIVTIDATATQELRKFDLDFVGFAIESVTVNDQAARIARLGRELMVEPSVSLEEGDAFRVVVAYAGRPQLHSSGMDPFGIGWFADENGAFVASEPDGAASWYPVNDHPRDKATYTFRVTVPADLEVAANGRLQEIIDQGSVRTHVWEARDPLASYLVTIAIGNFERREQPGPAGLLIRNYFPPRLADEADAYFADTPQLIEFFAGQFGPFPFEEYGALVVDRSLDWALETQTLSLFGSNDLEDEVGLIVVHELAHQWFGDSVSPATWQDVWLNEGFATYAEWLWLEHVGGASIVESAQEVASMFDDMPQWVPPGRPPPDDLFGIASYYGGALALYALRADVGEATFTQILRTFADRFKYGTATTGDFVAVGEEVSGRDLSTWRDDWLFDPDMPLLPG